MNRRECLFGLLGLAATVRGAGPNETEFAQVFPGRTLRFPQDEGSHPDFRTEWWYVTGWLDTQPAPLGFQVTFFRTRPHADSGNPSRFAPRHLLIAHAAVSDPAHGRLRHAQRSARAGFGLADAAIGHTAVWIDRWALRANEGGYATSIETKDFALDLQLVATQPPLLHGNQGYSQKGPDPRSASYYYSLPHLDVRGQVRVGAKTRAVTGSAWLDHEWSSQYMDREAVGWDWAGINLQDGSALMAFRMRRSDGASHWAAATLRTAGGLLRAFAPEQASWKTQRRWISPRSGASYPVAMQVHAGDFALDLAPLLDDQESDSRLSTGAIYWEGAVTALRSAKPIGRGYLELTGYAKPLRF